MELEDVEYWPNWTPTDTQLDDYMILKNTYTWQHTRINQAFAETLAQTTPVL